MTMVLAGLLAAAATPTGETEIVWRWVPDQTACLLRQDAGNGKFLDVGVRPGSRKLGISIVDTKARTRSAKHLGSVEATFSSGQPARVEAWIQPHRDPIGRSIGIWLGGEDRDQFSNASALSLSHDEFGTERAAIRSAAAAMDAIRVCEDRKMREWGIDPTAWRALSETPTPATPAEKWFSWLDYPDREKIYANDIDVVARLDVAVDGSVLKCTVVNRPPSEFIPAACDALTRRAAFHPARDDRGQPTAAPYIFVVRFAAYHL